MTSGPIRLIFSALFVFFPCIASAQSVSIALPIAAVHAIAVDFAPSLTDPSPLEVARIEAHLQSALGDLIG